MGFTIMSAQARYIIAKYVPEILRNEPRNFGVIVWSPEKLDARFSGETGGGGVDGRKIPEWVKSKTSYKEWVHYLRNCIAHGAVEIKGKVVRSDVPDFIDALKDVSNANYVLA